ncbi:MAG: hypothetical protein HY600_04295 [Candidatus Omnitrophica bacterium]|nr:hypothetical protein [Candidatus Omnitrophota bacterium]
MDDFEIGQTSGLFAERKNRLDAFQGTWARRPSSTVITKAPDARPGHPGTVLRIEYHKLGGWCGWYTLLNGIDVSPYNALTFWVRGERGGERFDIGLADERMQTLEIDAVYVGTIKAFLPQGVTTDWQLVRVPIASLRSEMDLTRMGSLVLWFRYDGAGAIQVDDVQFVNDPEVTRWQEHNRPRADSHPAAPRAMWVWKLDPVLSPQVRDDLFAFCEQTAITRLYLYLGESPVTRASPAYQAQLAEFLTAAHRRGLAVDALTGNPLWALRVNHQVLLDWIQGFLAYNAARPPEARIDGVHLDVEPYLITQWESDRDGTKRQYVELLQRCRTIVAAAKQPRFQLGIAIPLFYEREGEFEREVLSQVDYAGLMDYYDASVDLIEKAIPHIRLAGQLGKKITIGVETQDLVQMGQGKRRNTFHEEGWDEMEQQLALLTNEFATQPGFGGLAIHAYESYRLLQRGRNVPTRDRPAQPYIVPSAHATRPVAVDGDLAEWQGLTPIVVDKKAGVVYGAGAWKGPQDLSVKIWSQWDEQAVYLACDVTDNAVVQERRKGDMWEGDHIELWIDADLYGDYNEAMNSADDFQIGLSPGNFRDVPPEVFIWVPSVPPAILQAIAVAAKPRDRGYTVELRLPAAALFSTLQRRVGIEPDQKVHRAVVPQEPGVQGEVFADQRLRTGFRMGIMVDTSDTDDPHQPQKMLLSTSTDRTWGDPTTFGYLELQS